MGRPDYGRELEAEWSEPVAGSPEPLGDGPCAFCDELDRARRKQEEITARRILRGTIPVPKELE